MISDDLGKYVKNDKVWVLTNMQSGYLWFSFLK